MRLGVVVLILLSVVLGATFGALNSDRVAFDLYFSNFLLPKGVALMAALLLGWICGGLLVWMVRVRRLARELRLSKRLVRDLRTNAVATALPDGRPSDRA